MRAVQHLLFVICAGLWLAAVPQAMAEDAEALARALTATSAGDWPGAAAQAAQSGPLAEDIVAWHRLRAGRGTFAEYADFATRRADWPGMAVLLEKAEGAITPDTQVALIRDWFDAHPPLTGSGALAWLAALPDDAAPTQARLIWAEGKVPLSADQESRLLNGFATALTQADHESRARALLDGGAIEAARRVIPRTGLDFARLGSLRADVQSDRPGWQNRFRALHAHEADDPGLAYDRFQALTRAKNRTGAQALMLERSVTAESLGNPVPWAGLRADYSRLALREGQPHLARVLAEGHHLQPGDKLWPDLTFLAGYAALKDGDAPAALAQFQLLESQTQGLLSQSRALYWQARALEAMGDAASARAVMTRAAAHQASFYGQLAAESLGQPMAADFLHSGPPALPDWRDTPLREDARFQAAIWLQLAGASDLSARFLNHMAETAEPQDIGRMARLMTDFGQTHFALRLAKSAAARGATYADALFPLPGLDHPGFGVPEELVLAIARQESEFNPRAGSHVGARGLMQLMPATAQDIARQTGMEYDLARLSSEVGINARYGAYYLRQLRDRFGPSAALVAAGYNAGPGRAGQWLDSLGDIRTETDPVDWVEMIPYDETRNYVMRVAEALAIYRARLSEAPVPFTLLSDLSGGGVPAPPPGPRQTIPFTLTDAPSPPWKGMLPGTLPDPVTGPR